MSQADELLDSLVEDETATISEGSDAVVDGENLIIISGGSGDMSEEHIVVGEDRFITVPEELKRIAVQYDHDVETVTFDCPRYWDGLDMSTLKIYINYKRADGALGSYLATDVTVDATDSSIMHFNWTISGNVTIAKGEIKFLVCVKKTNESGMEVNHWNSEINTDMFVSEGLEGSETAAESYPDIINQLLERADEVDTTVDDVEKATEEIIELQEQYINASGDVNFVETSEITENVANAFKAVASDIRCFIKIPNISPIRHNVKIKVANVPEGRDVTTIPVVSSGKNMIPFPYPLLESGKVQGGITCTVQDDGGVCFNGTATGTTWWVLCKIPLWHADIAPNSLYIKSNGNDLNGSVWRVNYSSNSTETMIRLVAGTYDNFVVYPQIEYTHNESLSEYERGRETYSTYLSSDGTAVLPTVTGDTIITAGNPSLHIEVEYNKDINAALSFNYADCGLPVLYFEGDTIGMSKDNKVTLSYIYGDKTGSCTLKWQGSSSLAYPKKNYTVVFDNAFEAKEGWGEQTKYCLKANYIDFSHARNICSARLWGEIVKQRYYKVVNLEGLPNYGAVDGFPCLVVINGHYQGLYTFNVPKEAWMMGMGSGNREAILCAPNGAVQTGLKVFKSTADTLDGDSGFEIEYVSDENNSGWILDSLNTLVTACINSDGTDLNTTIAQYLDLESARDYFIYTVLLKAHDCIYKNFILATYDGVRWFFSAYDLDSTFGLDWDGSKFIPSYQTDGINADSFAATARSNRIFELLWNSNGNELLRRYKQLTRLEYYYNGGSRPMYYQHVEETFLNFAKDIPKAVLDEEIKLWPAIPSTSVNNVSQICNWYRGRLEQIDFELGV